MPQKKRTNPLFALLLFFLKAILYLSVPIGLGVLAFIYLSDIFLVAPDPAATETILIEVPPRTSAKKLAHDFEEQGLLKKWWAFYYLARATNNDTKLSAGEFKLSKAMNVPDLLEKLVSGDTYKRRVTIREGLRIKEIAPLFEKAGLFSAEEFLEAVDDPGLPKSLDLPDEAKSLEGFLFPETYFFSRPLTPKEAIRTLVETGKKQWTPEMEAALAKRPLDRYEVIKLASIIEKESGNVEEQPKIASVFYNRLRIGMRLQSDPTVIYGIKDFDGNITKKHLKTETPYNTYVKYGLPPTPIANPGLTALRAALFPEKTTYLYFVADGAGRHIFSTTLKDHNRAVHKYQKRIGASG